MEHEHEPPPPEDLDEEHTLPADIAEAFELARQAGDPWSMPPEERDAFFAGYYVGRESGYDDGYRAGYAASEAYLARLQRAAVAAARRGEAWPSLNPDNYRDDLFPDPFAPKTEEDR